MPEKIIVAGDFHYPRISESIYLKFLKFIEDCQPDYLVINGDFLDVDTLAKFIYLPTTKSFSESINGGREVLKEIRGRAPNAKIIYLEGNHEYRLRSYLLRKSPELWSMPQMSLPYLLDLNNEDLKIEWKPVRNNTTKFVDNYVKINDIIIAHADKALQQVGNSVRWLIERRYAGLNIIQGHCHKAALLWFRNAENKMNFGIEAGCMCELESPFTSETNWINSFVYIEDNKPELIIV